MFGKVLFIPCNAASVQLAPEKISLGKKNEIKMNGILSECLMCFLYDGELFFHKCAAKLKKKKILAH